MNAVVVRAFGSPHAMTVEQVPDPLAGEGQVVVEVAYASVTFVETQVRAGRPPNPAMLPDLPYVPGNGVGGVVRQLGRGAPPDLLGQTVVTPTGGSGGYAEQVAVPAAAIIAVPDGVDVRDAVALLADGRTALALVEAADLRPGETVLVEAAAGGVGSCLVQLALAAGARVIACAGGAEKAAIGVQLGAALAFDYADDTWDQGVRDAVGAVDVVFDGVGGVIGARAAGLLRPGGRFCRYGMASGTFTDLATARPANDVELRGLALTPQATRRLSTTALAQAAAGGLRPVVGQIFALEDAGRAHAAIEARVTIGKTLLDTDADAGVGARQEAA